MTLQMTNELPVWKAGTTIAHLEDECALAHENSMVDFRHGPFAAFSFVETPSSGCESTGLDSPSGLFDFVSTTDGPSAALFEESLLISDAINDAPFNTELSEVNPQLRVDVNSRSQQALLQTAMNDAPFLLKHFSDVVIPSLTPFRHKKTPWHILFLSRALLTLSTFAVGNHVDAADLTSFYGILAISALDLHSSSVSQRWQESATTFQYAAEDQLTSMLAHALAVPKVFKYKSAIVAILTMVQLSVSIYVHAESEASIDNSIVRPGHMGRD